jgi:hypothetical protein
MTWVTRQATVSGHVLHQALVVRQCNISQEAGMGLY